ncbi:tyrosine-type recombinase/integrase [Glaciecola sp. 2405UD65-10]|uniref:tyrosine-type recombinase/integrase n=1 Tax=Glaciecola sp. 2405UD65-10 TaxID=3397244 RepID=UPI003B58FE36
MANISDTSITKSSSAAFVKNADKDRQLTCTKIKGFYLRKTQTGGTWYYRYTDFAGKRRKLNLGKFVDGAACRMTAVDLITEFRNQRNKGEDPKQEIDKKKANFVSDSERRDSKLVSTYLNGSYTTYQQDKKNQGKHTIDMLKRAFDCFMDTPMDEISKADLAEWQAEYTRGDIVKKTGKRKPRSHDTVSRSFKALKTMVRHAYINDVLNSFPADFEKFKLKPESDIEKEQRQNKNQNKKRRLLSDNEIIQINQGLSAYHQQLVNGRENSRNHGKAHLPSMKNLAFANWFFPFFRLAAYSGMRPGDLYNLHWHQININFKVLVKTPNKTRHHANPAKLNIPLNNSIIQVLNNWRMQQGNPSDDSIVFPSPITGKELSRDAHEKPWANVLRLGNVADKLDFYALRHHYISKLVANNTPLLTVAQLAGHKSTKMIEEHYGHLAPNQAAKALDDISNDFGPTEQAISEEVRI